MKGLTIRLGAVFLSLCLGSGAVWAQTVAGKPTLGADKTNRQVATSDISKPQLIDQKISPSEDLVYRVDWGPLALAELTVSLSKDKGKRALAAKGETLGMMSLISDWSFSQAMVVEGDKRAVYSSRSFKDGDPYTDYEVVWADGGLPQVSGTLGEQIDKELTPIPAGELQNTASPYQPILQLVEQLADGQGCSLQQRVFDGVRRYDVTVVEEAREELEADRDWTYGGPSIKCRLIFKRVGGYAVEPSRWTVKEEQDVERFLWLARLRDDFWIPVRLKVSSPLGFATGRLVTNPEVLAAEDSAENDSWFSFGERDR